jgi:hypothetical protein
MDTDREADIPTKSVALPMEVPLYPLSCSRVFVVCGRILLLDD